jgi:hypothetical protein
MPNAALMVVVRVSPLPSSRRRGMLGGMAKPLAKLLSMLTPKRRWAQFSLSTVFLLVALCACVAYAYSLRIEMDVIRREKAYFVERAGFDAGVSTIKDVHNASVRWMDAERRLPMSDRVAACSRHLERMTEIFDLVESTCIMGPGKHPKYDEAAMYRDEARNRLAAELPPGK